MAMRLRLIQNIIFPYNPQYISGEIWYQIKLLGMYGMCMPGPTWPQKQNIAL